MNRQLLKETMKFVKNLASKGKGTYESIRNQDYWDQKDYGTVHGNTQEKTCGTSACFAGWAGILKNPKEDHESILSEMGCLQGAKDLGLNIESSHILFSEKNTIEDLENIVNHLLGHESISFSEGCALTGHDARNA